MCGTCWCRTGARLTDAPRTVPMWETGCWTYDAVCGTVLVVGRGARVVGDVATCCWYCCTKPVAPGQQSNNNNNKKKKKNITDQTFCRECFFTVSHIQAILREHGGVA